MKDHHILQLISDPEFNPVSWMGDAIKEFIKINPHRVLKDQVCCPYIFQAMEPHDATYIAKNLPEDLNIIEKFIDAINKLEEDNYYTKQAKNRTARALYCWGDRNNKDKKDEIYRKICHIHNLREVPLIERYLSMEDLLIGLQNWSKRNFEIDRWISLINLIPQDKFQEFLSSISRRDLVNGYRSSRWPYVYQTILMRLLQKAPVNALNNWSNIINEINKWSLTDDDYEYSSDERVIGLAEIYNHNTKYNHSKKKMVTYYDPRVRNVLKKGKQIQIDDLMCRCGHVARSKSGFTLHREKSDNLDCRKTPLMVAYRIRLARAGLSLDCPKCGKSGNSPSGQTNHEKKCMKYIDIFDPAESSSD